MARRSASERLAWAKVVLAEFKDGSIQAKRGAGWDQMVNIALLTVAGAGDVSAGRRKMLELLHREIEILSMVGVVR